MSTQTFLASAAVLFAFAILLATALPGIAP